MSSFLDPVFGWVLLLNPALGIFIISLIVSILVTLAIKFLTNQSLMKDLRNEMQELQKQMKELRNNPKKLTQINTRFMETNMKYMSHSMRPTLYTFIPMLLVFGWLNSAFAYNPIMPGQQFNIDAYFEKTAIGKITINPGENFEISGEKEQAISEHVSWILKAKDEGSYNITFLVNGKEYTKDILITKERKYAPVMQEFRKRGLFFSSPEENGFNKVVIGNKPIVIFEDVPVLNEIPWVKTWGWLGGYILFSFLFSMGLRKVFKVY